jgi:hypothetical protein
MNSNQSIHAEIHFMDGTKLSVFMFSQTTMAELIIELRKAVKISQWMSVCLFSDNTLLMPQTTFGDLIKLIPAKPIQSTEMINPLFESTESKSIRIDCLTENTFGSINFADRVSVDKFQIESKR